MFRRVLNSSGVHTALIGLVSAVILAASNGSLDEGQVSKIIEMFMTYIIPAVIVKIGFEDGMKKIGQPPPPDRSEWKEVP